MTAPTLIGPVLDDIIDNLTIVEMEQHLDHDVPCLVGANEKCPEAATWAVRCPTCGLDWTACDRDRGELDVRALPRWGLRVRCTGNGIGCMGIIPIPINWRPL